MRHNLWSYGKRTVRRLLTRVSCSRAVTRWRSSRRHAAHVLRHGRSAWRYVSDMGLNGTVTDLESCFRRHLWFDVNMADSRGNTLLIQSARTNNVTMLHYLLRYKDSDITRTNKDGKTALLVALESRAVACVDVLAQYGAVRDAERRQFFPIHAICTPEAFHLESLAILLRYGADINAFKPNVGTPLQAAVRSHNRPLAYLLLHLGGQLHPDGTAHHKDLQAVLSHTDAHVVERAMKSASRVACRYLKVHALSSKDTLSTRDSFRSYQEGKDSVEFLDRLISIGAVRTKDDVKVEQDRRSSSVFLTLHDVSYWYPGT